jgi:hypothetical protein
MKVENLKHPFILWVIVVFFGDFWDIFWRNFSLNREFVTGYSFIKIFFAKKGENSLPKI